MYSVINSFAHLIFIRQDDISMSWNEWLEARASKREKEIKNPRYFLQFQWIFNEYYSVEKFHRFSHVRQSNFHFVNKHRNALNTAQMDSLIKSEIKSLKRGNSRAKIFRFSFSTKLFSWTDIFEKRYIQIPFNYFLNS